MKIWLLYKGSATKVHPESFEIQRLLETAKAEGIDARLLSPEQFDLTVTREDRRSILVDGESVELPDVLIPRMGAGTTYFSLAVIRHLERIGVYSLNSSQSIETVRDKLFTQQILAENNLPVPKTMLVKFPIDVELVEKQIGFPVVVKPISGSQGSGVFLSESKSSFQDLMQLVEATNESANIILQEFIGPSRGRDLRVMTLGGRVVACMERRAPDGEFKANFSTGGTVTAFEVTPEIEWPATQTSQLLGLDMAGIDLLFAGDRYMVCEANSSPGFEGLESCSDIDVAKDVYHFLRIRTGVFKAHNSPHINGRASTNIEHEAHSVSVKPTQSVSESTEKNAAQGSLDT